MKKKNILIAKSEGTSMVPFIYQDQLLVIKKRGAKSIKLFDIVAYYRNKRLIAHRVVYKGKKILITKGDCITRFDQFVDHKDVIGTVVRVLGKDRALHLDSFPLKIATGLFVVFILSFQILPKLCVRTIRLKLNNKKVSLLTLFHEKYYAI